MNPSYSAQIPKLRPGDMNNQTVLDRLTDHLNSLQLQAGKGISIRRQGSAGTVVEATAQAVSAGGGGGGDAYSGMFAVSVDTATRIATIASGTLVRCSEMDGSGTGFQASSLYDGSYFTIPESTTTIPSNDNSTTYLYIDLTFDFAFNSGVIVAPTYTYGTTIDPLPMGDHVEASGKSTYRYFLASIAMSSSAIGDVTQLHIGVLRAQKRLPRGPFSLFMSGSGMKINAGEVFIGSVRKTVTEAYLSYTASEGLWYVMLDIYYASNEWKVDVTTSKTRLYSTSTNHRVVVGTFNLDSSLKVVRQTQYVTSDVYVCGRWVD